MMKKLILITAIFILFSCKNEKFTTNKTDLSNKIDSYISSVIEVQEIPGIAIAILENDKVIYKKFYGKSALGGESINNKTIFRLYSLSKLMVSVGIFQLVEEEKIALDDKLSKFFNDLPEKWQQIRIVNLLSHSSGLPDVRHLTDELSNDSINDVDFIKLLFKDKMDFVTDEQWSYNQTNFLLLKLIIEKITKISFEEYILNNQFTNAKRNQVLFSSDPYEDIVNRAKYYDFDKEDGTYKMKPEFPGKRSHPLNGVNITLEEFIKWNQRLDTNELLRENTKALMWTPFNFKKSNREFLNGWDVYSVNNYKSFGFSGGGVSGYRKFVDKNLSIIVVMNGYKYYSVQDIIIDRIAGIVDESLKDDDLILQEEILAKYFLKDNNQTMEAIFSEVKKKNPNRNLEEVFKSVGYQLFFQLNKKNKAIELFQLNVNEYPDSYDTYGSLGYLYFLTDQFELAKENYIKAQELNPDNTYSERRINQINEILKDKK